MEYRTNAADESKFIGDYISICDLKITEEKKQALSTYFGSARKIAPYPNCIAYALITGIIDYSIHHNHNSFIEHINYLNSKEASYDAHTESVFTNLLNKIYSILVSPPTMQRKFTDINEIYVNSSLYLNILLRKTTRIVAQDLTDYSSELYNKFNDYDSAVNFNDFNSLLNLLSINISIISLDFSVVNVNETGMHSIHVLFEGTCYYILSTFEEDFIRNSYENDSVSYLDFLKKQNEIESDSISVNIKELMKVDQKNSYTTEFIVRKLREFYSGKDLFEIEEATGLSSLAVLLKGFYDERTYKLIR